jgi:hypothetical protein
MSPKVVRWYRFFWKNREIPRGTLVELISTGKLNSVRVRALDGREWITDRRALRVHYIGPEEDMERIVGF